MNLNDLQNYILEILNQFGILTKSDIQSYIEDIHGYKPKGRRGHENFEISLGRLFRDKKIQRKQVFQKTHYFTREWADKHLDDMRMVSRFLKHYNISSELRKVVLSWDPYKTLATPENRLTLDRDAALELMHLITKLESQK